MNIKTIISEVTQDMIRVHNDRFTKQEKYFLLNHEEIGTRVFSSKDEMLEDFYLRARGYMNHLVTSHLRQMAHKDMLLSDGLPPAASEALTFTTDSTRFNSFRFNVNAMGIRMKDLNLL